MARIILKRMSTIWILISLLSLISSLIFWNNIRWKEYRCSALCVLIRESSLRVIDTCMEALCTSLVSNWLKLGLTARVRVNTCLGVVVELLRSSNTYVPFLAEEGTSCLIVVLSYASWTCFSIFCWWFSTENRFSSSFTASCAAAFSIARWTLPSCYCWLSISIVMLRMLRWIWEISWSHWVVLLWWKLQLPKLILLRIEGFLKILLLLWLFFHLIFFGFFVEIIFMSWLWNLAELQLFYPWHGTFSRISPTDSM